MLGKESIQKECMKWDRIKRNEIKDEINRNQSILKYSICKKELEIGNNRKWDIHARLHVLDKNRYLQKDNCIVVCRSCHIKLDEKYELSDGRVIRYSKK